MPAPILIVAGPTASGKSALALALAEEFAGTVINADSMQVYRDLRVLTARPGPEAEARAPHRLYGMIDAAESCSAGRWKALALAEIAAASAAGRIPIITGGTGLYIHSLIHGLAPVPPIPEAIREDGRKLHAQIGSVRFHALLADRDPAGAARLAPGDTQRVLRAYEVVAATGRPLGEWQRLSRTDALGKVAAVTLLPPRAALYAACDARLVAMMQDGGVAEAEALLARQLPDDRPAMKAVGVREIGLWLSGRLGREEAIAAAQQATRRYAKRQYTWMRHRMAGLHGPTFETQFSESLLPEIFAFIRQCLLTARN
ncbi:MAG TPA: tRNA (adenosine(37)-N6)-dimethylallyltransferase MiaA [Stellaceae bacterium]|nr:tRNA (adenosine(37)-N6)-dimethylallyltransferase MiaA [Stellaceae bacterium]